MKRFWIGIILLGILLGAGLWVMTAAEGIHEPVGELLEEAAEKSLAGEFTEGVALARQARQKWQQYWKTVAAGADHEPMDEIDSLFAQIEVYASREQVVAFAAGCARLGELIEAMAEAHSLSWWSILSCQTAVP